MQSANDLKQLLFSINHKSYPAYKSTRGAYQFPRYTLSIDHVQGDPFAAPSRVSVHISGKTAAFPAFLYDTYEKRVALQDYLLRQFARAIAPYSFRAKGSGKSGLLGISRCGQEILERTACVLNASDGSLIINMEIGFPANGRTIASQELIRILFDFLPGCVEKSLFYRALDPKACANVARLCEDQQAIRAALKEKGLTAFIADGSILPRETGVSDLPMKHAVPFISPESLRITLDLPNRGPVSGMGIPLGVTLIVGGGFHGKSTLLQALERGVYNHISGDGREYVITDASAAKLRGGKGVKCYKITEKTGNLIGSKAVNEDNEIMMITTEGIIIRTPCSGISVMGRITSGVKLMDVDGEIKVASIAKVRDKEASEETSVSEKENETASEKTQE